MDSTPVRREDLDSIAGRIRYWAGVMGTFMGKVSHIAAGTTSISLIVGGSQAGIVVTWPGGGFPTDEYDIEAVPLAAGITSVVVTAQTATTATCTVTAGLGLAIGAAFLLKGQS